MNVEVVVPAMGSRPLSEVLDLVDSVEPLRPFADAVLDFCALLSRTIATDTQARGRAELQSLAFWVRRTELEQMRRDFEALSVGGTLLVPRGLVFHIPPANVDTMFVYSWLIALLTGNRSIIRLSSRTSEDQQLLIRLIAKALEAPTANAVKQSSVFVRYGHDDEITAAISGRSDVRMIWGGDQTVTRVRSLPARARGKDVAFADRFSFATVDTGAYLRSTPDQRADLANGFFNDTYWFAQLGCSSPRLLVWCGSLEDATVAAPLFWRELRAVIDRRGYEVDAGGTLRKMAFAHAAVIDRPVTAYESYGNELTVLSLNSLLEFDRHHCGFGLVLQYVAAALSDLVPFVRDRDQTMTHYGFSKESLAELALVLNGRGIDRYVPIGQALNFGRVWDGYDLFQELTKRIVVKT